jgi:cyanophycinase
LFFFFLPHSSYRFQVDQNTALVVTDVDTVNASMEIIGENGVWIVDVRTLQTQNKRGEHDSWVVKNLAMTYLTLEDRYVPLRDAVSFAHWKRSLAKRQPHEKAPTGDDILSSVFQTTSDGSRLHPREFANVSIGLYLSRQQETYGVTFENDPQFRLDLRKQTTLEGVSGVHDDVQYVSFNGMLVQTTTLN